jgi:hypothetical protein
MEDGEAVAIRSGQTGVVGLEKIKRCLPTGSHVVIRGQAEAGGILTLSLADV